ncbi:chloride channel protein [Clostridium cadaveris]|uniref:H+/Cl-antiporter ClcA n=1 Tax=Clostridium cadaveris TaxID=1529 RepID=A0A1I2MVA3_9CLOT|nr:chloride channel protein [Clostridium cadaveris]MDM8311641.1 chloride channel protein [Clostridium cadaveris]NME65065.1 chloride channel protein [Clostridium cadaveris]NWK11897.1 chloride channel protein [Clostridium cadaveris]UFH66298.1 chloride channel protein [Clostridium cadaveris]SFF93266.1 H+/Cl-antiporter ClcA [Clostridium cadaveris]
MSFDLDHLRNIIHSIKIFFKWVFFSIIIGLIVGIFGTLFHYSIEIATKVRMDNPWIFWFLPVGGILIVFFYSISNMLDDKGTNLLFLSVRSDEKPSIKTAPLIFVATTLTHLFGGSSGREGAALQLGGSIACGIGQKLKLDDKDLNLVIMCGMSAGFSALFRTPLTAALFSIEVISIGVMHYSALVPCALASIIGYSISGFFKVSAPFFKITGIPVLDILPVIKVIFLASICALVSILFCHAMHVCNKSYKKYIKNPYLRIVAGGFIVIVLTLIVDSNDYLGAGMDIIENAINGDASTWAWLLKIIFTALTLGAGFKGGEIVPAFFVGATLGNVVSGLIGLNPSFGAAIGLIALFCGVTNCPITAFILGIEIFGAHGALFFMVASAVSYMLSGYYGLYSEQKIVYSKLKPEFIDKRSI